MGKIYADITDTFNLNCLFTVKMCVTDDIIETVKCLLTVSRPSLKLQTTVNYEGRAVALIIFILKLALSLDGQTEIASSKAARLLNKSVILLLYIVLSSRPQQCESQKVVALSIT